MQFDSTLRENAREARRVRWRQTGWYSTLTIADALAVGAKDHGADVLLFTSDGAAEGRALGELRDRAAALAGGLHARGIHPGSVVVVQAPAGRAGTEVLEALWLLGAVVVPVVLTASDVELDHIVDEVHASHLVVTPEWRGRDLLEQARAVAAPRNCEVHVLGELPEGDSIPALQRDPSQVCCVLYTSGSTALPKGVQHSHETLLAGLTAAPSDTTTRALATFPSGHVASLLGLLRPLSVGGTTVVMDRWSARHAAALIEEHRLDTSAGTPFFLSTLLDEAERTGRNISSLRRFLCGAAAVPPVLVQRAEERGIICWRTYGSTEHPSISSGTPDDPADKRTFTDGRVGPGNEVRLLDDEGMDVPPGEVGEIVARGPKQFLGYRDPTLDDDAFIDVSWFRTGDLGRFDEDGYLIVTDRLKDIIIRGGENISAREVEDVLASHAGVEEVAVCAAPDDTWGEVVCAFVRVADGASVSLNELCEHGRRQGLAAHKAPAQLVIVDDFPRTAAGKVRKQALRESNGLVSPIAPEAAI